MYLYFTELLIQTMSREALLIDLVTRVTMVMMDGWSPQPTPLQTQLRVCFEHGTFCLPDKCFTTKRTIADIQDKVETP